MKPSVLIAVLPVVLSAASVAPAVAQHEHPAGDPNRLGRVRFSTSCDASVQSQFESAVAMLHSFWYEKARDTFASVAEKDPACGMAYWGLAMTHYHPIWEAPGPADRESGRAAVEKARSAGARTQRERDWPPAHRGCSPAPGGARPPAFQHWREASAGRYRLAPASNGQAHPAESRLTAPGA